MNKRRQSGSALTEFAILGTVMIPLFFMMPTLGKMTDVNHSTIQASRYMAWERTVSDASHKDTATMATELHNRFFIRPDLHIKTEQGKINSGNAINPFWKSRQANQDGEKKTLVDSRVRDRLYVEEEQAGLGSAGTMSRGIAEVGEVLSGFLPDANWNLEGEGLYIAKVGVDVSNTGLVARSGDNCAGNNSAEIFACINRHNAILVDGWSSFSKSQVEERTRSFVPGAVLRPVGDMLSAAGAIPLVKELKDLDGAFGHVDVDVLPLDRYEVK